MSESETDRQAAQLEPEVRDMKLEPESPADDGGAHVQGELETDRQEQALIANGSASPPKSAVKSSPHTPAKMESGGQTPAESLEGEEVVGGDITVKVEPGKAPKLARSSSQRIEKKPPPLFLDYEDKTLESTTTFTLLEECTYGNKYMGSTEHALECDCAEEWDSESKKNLACGEDSDCINRATKMECVGDCGCGPNCQNQRFLRKQYADVTVIKTEKKGYGLRANANLKPNDFVFEYIGEVINEGHFRRRMTQYDHEGIKHFYFMSLTKGEFVDATKKGNLGRFCNHSCNPNCYVDKWVVGDKLRMGIFAERHIRAGEELVFNYNVDRYGADPQPCYCGEQNCTGYIGGKTQTERATKLSHTTIEALGIDDSDGWDTAVAKKPRKKKVAEDDEEYVNNVQPKSLEEGGVTKVMATLMQCKEKWIAVKLLSRIQRSDDERVMNRVIRMHGYQILKTALNNFFDDNNVCLQILEILDKMPRLSRNKIQNSNIEETVEKLKSSEHEQVASKAGRLLYEWSQLKMEYRIPRVKRDPNIVVESRRNEREERERKRSRSRSKSPAAPKGPSAPRNALPARPPFAQARQFRRPPQLPLPPGWFMAHNDRGKPYYYSSSGETTWQCPTAPAAQPPPPPRENEQSRRLEDIIRSITEGGTPKTQTPAESTTPQATESAKKEKKPSTEKWRSLTEEQQKKLYKKIMWPHINAVLHEFKNTLPRDDLKRFGKELSDKLANSDYKNGRVQDPTKIAKKQIAGIKQHCKEFLGKAVKKRKEREDRKRAQEKAKPTAPEENGSTTPLGEPGLKQTPEDAKAGDEGMPHVSDDEFGDANEESPISQTDSHSKRKRDEETPNGTSPDDDVSSASKKQKIAQLAPPPPPPPPPADGSPVEEQDDVDAFDGADANQGTAADGEATENSTKLLNEASVERNMAVKVDGADASGANGHPSPMQLATPSTSDSCEGNSDRMNPERLRQLGVTSGR
ncbi:hypothetical protein IWX90DRAFT_182302 [Phyllosticta citrichinensis]|uniref:Histone-lysine N-methyltransferase, H3 lysine-36 specific n=1 Tax=Phyllosticta citrichinensis TaxID=1130410 RepID=A0ABR1XWH4_9PEZI